MITEDYVSFETAKLLKEKGFDLCTYAYYEDEDNPNISLRASKAINWNKNRTYLKAYSKPTIQMAMKWLREKHKLTIEPKMSKNTFLWGYRVSLSNGSTICLYANIFNKYEEACEAAIKFCLENLI